MDTNQQHDDGEERPTGDLLVGAAQIHAYLVELGMPEDTDIYHIRRRRTWPIGKTSGEGGQLIASKRRLRNHAEKITRGP